MLTNTRIPRALANELSENMAGCLINKKKGCDVGFAKCAGIGNGDGGEDRCRT